MSYQRAQRRAVNRQVLLDNRLSTLTNAHNYVGDLHIERNETVGGNLDVSGDLTVMGDIRARSYYATGNYYLDNYVLIPAGTIIQSAAMLEPEGWLDCDGRTLSVFANADLFDAIGYGYSVGVYGGEDLSFNIPDMRGRVGIGYGTGSGLTARSLGAKGGAETHTLTVEEMPGHDHGGSTGGTTSAATNSTDAGVVVISGTSVADNGSHSHTISSQGGGQGHNNMQPFLVIRYLIKY
jgi:microcystin-dependent protein